MTSYSHNADTYLNSTSTRSPRSVRQPQLHRQTSRPFDAYGSIPTATSLYPTEDPMASSRFDTGRSLFNPPMQSTSMNGGHFPYDYAGSQSWNNTGNTMQSLGGNPSGFMAPVGSFAATGRLKPSRGRNGLPNVSMNCEAVVTDVDPIS